MSGKTPNPELRELVEQWRQEADKCADEGRGPLHGSPYGNGVSAGLRHTADELEELIEERESDE